ncbi:hypothetical protein D3C81_1942700 [compost metagenome]
MDVPNSNLAFLAMLARRPDEPVIMAHLPLMNSEFGSSPRPPYMKMPSLPSLARFSRWRTCSGVLMAMRASRPPKPLSLVA